jgi:CO dehydrogenase/acetyl-CoA synthase alpha subunit
MDVPFDITLTLRRGTVYYFQHRDLSSVEPHCFIVVNTTPIGQKVILMTVFTSQIEKQERAIRRAGHPAETLVRINPSDYPDLTKESCVNCNKVFSKTLAELVQLWPGMIKKPTDLPSAIVQEILNGIEKSSQVSEEEKSLIRESKIR